MEPNEIENVSWNITLCLTRNSLAICGHRGYQMKDMDAKNATILLGPIRFPIFGHFFKTLYFQGIIDINMKPKPHEAYFEFL